MNKLGEIDSETYYGERDVESMYKFIKDKSTSGGAKKPLPKPIKKPIKKVAKKPAKEQKGGCGSHQCGGGCKGGKCKPQKGGAEKKKRGRGRPKDPTLVKMKKKVKKTMKKLKKVSKVTLKKMLGGKKQKK